MNIRSVYASGQKITSLKKGMRKTADFTWDEYFQSQKDWRNIPEYDSQKSRWGSFVKNFPPDEDSIYQDFPILKDIKEDIKANLKKYKDERKKIGEVYDIVSDRIAKMAHSGSSMEYPVDIMIETLALNKFYKEAAEKGGLQDEQEEFEIVAKSRLGKIPRQTFLTNDKFNAKEFEDLVLRDDFQQIFNILKSIQEHTDKFLELLGKNNISYKVGEGVDHFSFKRHQFANSR